MGNATNETTKKTNWLDAIKAQFKRIIWPTKEEAARRSAVVLAVSVLLGVIIAVLDSWYKSYVRRRRCNAIR